MWLWPRYQLHEHLGLSLGPQNEAIALGLGGCVGVCQVVTDRGRGILGRRHGCGDGRGVGTWLECGEKWEGPEASFL